MCGFGEMSDKETESLAKVLRSVLQRLYYGLSDPDFNYVIRSAPRGCNPEAYHWYLSVVPRVERAAGFELGSGMYINASPPEDSAAFLKSVEIPK
jgi:UDPglucose--hexose-1-phosphate uridylyltransferase